MNAHRKTDRKSANHFRTDRYFQSGGQWFFNTREGTIEGPFTTREQAVAYLKTYAENTNCVYGTLDLTLEPTGTVSQERSKVLHFDPYQGRFGRFSTAA